MTPLRSGPRADQSRQPTPGERLGSNRTPLARPGCAHRWAMNTVARLFLLAAVGFLTGCQPEVSDQDLGFLATQKKPLTYQTVAKRLGDTEPGQGPFYAYPIRGTKKRVEFWFSLPPPPSQTTASSIPVEIAVVAMKEDGAKPTILWPEDLKGRDFDQVMASIYPRRQ